MEEKDSEINTNPFLEHGISTREKEKDKALFSEISSIIYDYITGGGHDYTTDKSVFRASSMGTCSRKILLEKHLDTYLTPEDKIQLPMWYKKELLKNQVDQPQLEFGAHIAGQVIHEVIQSALESRINSIEQEVSKNIGNGKLMGHYDILMEYNDGEKIVIDIKSTSSSREYLPNFKHLKQLMAYQGMLGGIKGALLYVNRNSFELSFVSQEFDKEKFTQIAQKISNLTIHETNETLPPPTPEFDYECKNNSFTCQFYKFCFGQEDENS